METMLKARRNQLGLKQKFVAEQAGITSQYLMKLEMGKAKNPSTDLMWKLSQILNSTVDELFFKKPGE